MEYNMTQVVYFRATKNACTSETRRKLTVAQNGQNSIRTGFFSFQLTGTTQFTAFGNSVWNFWVFQLIFWGVAISLTMAVSNQKFATAQI